MVAMLRNPAVVLDVADLERGAAFWSALLGVEPGPPRSGGSYLTVGPLDGGPLLVLQKTPDPKVCKNRMHLDFRVMAVEAACSAIRRLGGSVVSSPRDGGGVTVADPDGNEFCIGAFVRNRVGARVL
jgi:predicted enzyme related to lactoylglutathione lyase